MKRPCTALCVLLATLAACLVVSPQGSNACSLGELAVAMQVVHHDCDAGSYVCPLAACPHLDDCDEAECGTPGLNAADSDAAAVDSACDECYGAYEDYSHDYADQYEDESAQCEMPAAETTPNLNPAETDTTATDCFEEYGAEYAEEYRTEDDETVYLDEELPCDATASDDYPCQSPCDESYGEEDFYGQHYDLYRAVIEDADCRASDADLIVEECEEEVAPSCPEVDQTDSAELPELVNPYDAYGRQVGDDQYEAEAACPEAYDSYSCEYGDYCEGYEHNAAEDSADEAETTEETSTDETTVQVCPGSYDDCYGDCYGDCYHYYYGCEEPAEQPADDSSDETTTPATDAAAEDYSSGYDSAYDEAVYGPQEECTPYDDDAPPVLDEAMLEDESEYDMPSMPEATREPLVEGDLPWADDVDDCSSETATAEVESEYGSDYAEEYYGSLAHEVELPEEAAASDGTDESSDNSCEETTDDDLYELIPPLYEGETHDDCQATAPHTCATASGVDVSRLAVVCGKVIAGWSQLLTEMTQSIRTAHVDLMRFGR